MTNLDTLRAAEAEARETAMLTAINRGNLNRALSAYAAAVEARVRFEASFATTQALAHYRSAVEYRAARTGGPTRSP